MMTSMFPVSVIDIKKACKNARVGIPALNKQKRKDHDNWWENLKKGSPIFSRLLFRKLTEKEHLSREKSRFYCLEKLEEAYILSPDNQFAQLEYWDIQFVKEWLTYQTVNR